MGIFTVGFMETVANPISIGIMKNCLMKNRTFF